MSDAFYIFTAGVACGSAFTYLLVSRRPERRPAERDVPPPAGLQELPTHCADCRTLLRGGATMHAEGCVFGEMINSFYREEYEADFQRAKQRGATRY